MNNLLLLCGGQWSLDLQWVNKLATLNLFYSKLFSQSILSFCILQLLYQLILDRFSCVVPADWSSFCMLREEPGSELAITFLHYKILTSWWCKEGGEGQQGTVSLQFIPGDSGEQSMG